MLKSIAVSCTLLIVMGVPTLSYPQTAADAGLTPLQGRGLDTAVTNMFARIVTRQRAWRLAHPNRQHVQVHTFTASGPPGTDLNRVVDWGAKKTVGDPPLSDTLGLSPTIRFPAALTVVPYTGPLGRGYVMYATITTVKGSFGRCEARGPEVRQCDNKWHRLLLPRP